VVPRTIVALALVALLAAAGCTASYGSPPAGALVPVTPKPDQVLYSPVDRSALAYGLPSAVAGSSLVASPRTITLADEQDLADDVIVHRILVERGLGPDIIRIEQREDTFEEMPTIAVSAVQLKGVPADEFADFVPSVYLLATSLTIHQHNLTGAKPARESRTVDGREVRYADWGDFQLIWYPHGDVVYVILADTPEKLAAALRLMPWPGETL
jgi:hypothetical protein